jgi:hypothetical protein
MTFFTLLLTLVSTGTAQEGDLTFKSGVANVRVDAQVTQDGNVITGLTAQDFVVRENDQIQPIVYFGREQEPLSLLLLFDVSGSMRKYVEQVANVARQALRYLRVKDRVAVMVFARDAYVRTDFTDDMSTIASQIREAASDESVGTATNINDALLTAATHMEEKSGDTGRKALLILTDNMGLNYKSPDAPVIDAFELVKHGDERDRRWQGTTAQPLSKGRAGNPDFTPPDVFTISEQTGGEAVNADAAGEAFQPNDRAHPNPVQHSLQNAGFGHGRIPADPSGTDTLRELRYPRAEVRARKGYRVGGPVKRSKAD